MTDRRQIIVSVGAVFPLTGCITNSDDDTEEPDTTDGRSDENEVEDTPDDAAEDTLDEDNVSSQPDPPYDPLLPTDAFDNHVSKMNSLESISLSIFLGENISNGINISGNILVGPEDKRKAEIEYDQGGEQGEAITIQDEENSTYTRVENPDGISYNDPPDCDIVSKDRITKLGVGNNLLIDTITHANLTYRETDQFTPDVFPDEPWTHHYRTESLDAVDSEYLDILNEFVSSGETVTDVDCEVSIFENDIIQRVVTNISTDNGVSYLFAGAYIGGTDEVEVPNWIEEAKIIVENSSCE